MTKLKTLNHPRCYRTEVHRVSRAILLLDFSRIIVEDNRCPSVLRAIVAVG